MNTHDLFWNLKFYWIQFLVVVVVSGFLHAQNTHQYGGDVSRPGYESFRSDKLLLEGEGTYSGDLAFSIPLIVVPGRNGHNFEIKINYNSNVSQRQNASWVGLGWNMEIGAVERSVIARTDEQPEGLYSYYSLLNQPNLPIDRAEKIGRLNANHASLTYQDPGNYGSPNLKDQSDFYNLLVEGGGTEILPFPDTMGKRDTLSKDHFLSLQWKAWEIKAHWNPAGQNPMFTGFDVTKEDGTIFQFGGENISGAVNNHYLGGPLDGHAQHWSFPYRWNLTRIKYTDGDSTTISYANHNSSSNRYKRYGSVVIDRSSQEEQQNMFGPTVPYSNANPYDTSAYEYSSPDTIKTSTHYLVFKSSQPSGDVTERNRKLDTLILYDRTTNVELKRVIFSYATIANSVGAWDETFKGQSPSWDPNSPKRLNNDQLTLIQIAIKSGSDTIPPYKFSYYHNPKIYLPNLVEGANGNSGFPGYYRDTTFAMAWRLKEMTVSTGAKISYGYERINNSSFKVYYDPQGNLAPDTANYPWSYKAQPRARLKWKTVYDPVDNITRAWSYSYGTAVYDSPSKPLQTNLIPSFGIYRSNSYDPKEDYYIYYSGCSIGHRWVQTTNPDGSLKKIWFTSSYQGPGFNVYESQPDSFYFDPASVSIYSRAGRRGLIWKVETSSDTTLNIYSYKQQGAFNDKYVYHNLWISPPGSGGTFVQQTSIWAKADTTISIKDGVTTLVAYQYNPTRRESSTGNGLIKKMTEIGSQFDRMTEYKYAQEKYTAMDAQHMWSQLYSTTIRKGSSDDESKEWTTWSNSFAGSRWLPFETWRWNTSSSATTAPVDPTADTVRLGLYEYDSQGYCNRIQMTDANGYIKKFYYGDVSNPFTSTTAGLIKGYITGIEDPISSPLLRRAFYYNHYGNVIKVKDENDDSTKYFYDALGRLIQIIGPSDQTLSTQSFSLAGGSISATNPNLITNTKYLSASDLVVSKEFTNGFALPIQQQVAYADSDIITHTTYDIFGRLSKSYKTYQKDLGSSARHKYDPSFDANAKSYYTSIADTPYALSEYYNDGSNRIKHQHAPGSVFHNETNKRYLQYFYGSNVLEGFNSISTTSQDPLWSARGGTGITVHEAVNDSDIPDDYDYVTLEGNLGDIDLKEFKVKLSNYSGRTDPSLQFTVKFRVRQRWIDESPSPYINIRLLEGSTTRGFLSKGGTDIPHDDYATYSFSVSSSSISDPNNLYVSVDGGGYFDHGKDALDISWIRVELTLNETYRTTVVNENGIKDENFYDKFGNAVTTLADSGGLNFLTTLSYDVLGNITKSTPPKGSTYATTYEYNTQSQLTSKTTPDAGTTQYLYDKNGNLRLIKDANHTAASTNSFSPSNTYWSSTTETGSFTMNLPGKVNIYLSIIPGGSDYLRLTIKASNGTTLTSYQTGQYSYSNWMYLPAGSYQYEVTSVITVGGHYASYTLSSNSGYEFIYRKYDVLNRLTEEGEYESNSISNFTQGNANNTSFPSSNTVVTKKLFYDSPSTNPIAAGQQNLKGRLSYSYAYRLGGICDESYYSYDDFGRVAWIVKYQHGYHQKKLIYEYDRQGNTTKRGYIDPIDGRNMFTFYGYDIAGRLASVGTSTEEDPLIVLLEGQYAYYASGKVKWQILDDVQTVDYTYNERDWLKTINNVHSIGTDKFAEQLHYFDSETGLAPTNQYNGNVSWVSYNMPNVAFNSPEGIGSSTKLGYVFNYDGVNRLTNANLYWHGTHTELYPPQTKWWSTQAYGEKSFSYDQNGNIVSFQRYGNNATAMDNLTYNYSSNTNKLSYIDDVVSPGSFTNDIDDQSSGNYVYDGNGNMTRDLGNSIAFVIYDINNLPVDVYKTNGERTIFSYDANGNRVRKFKTPNYINDNYYMVGPDGKTDLVQKNVYNYNYTYNLWGNDNLGQIVVNYSTENRFYFLKDHLGTNRVTVNSNGVVDSYTDYYPFGMMMEYRNSTSSSDNRYKFTSKERDTETGYDYFGARYYDGRVGRWLAVDPLAEKYSSLSPYNYVANNPIRNIDPDGKDIWDYAVGIGEAIWSNVNPTYTRSEVSHYGGDQTDFATGRVVGDVTSLAIGGVEMVAGYTGEVASIVVSGTGVGTIAGVPGVVVSSAVAAHGALTTAVAAKNLSESVNTLSENTSKSSTTSGTEKQSKVEPTKTTESIGGKYTKTTEVRPGKGPGQSRAEYVRYKNAKGKTIKTYKDSYDRANKFQGRKPLRGGPEGRQQNDPN